MKKNVASQHVGGQIINATTGAPVTASVSVSISGDGGAFGASGGTLAHLGNGWWDYIPTQAETNYDFVAYQFTATGAIPYTASAYTTFPQTGDSFVRVGAPVGASISADIAAVKTDTAAIKTKTDSLTFTVAGLADSNVVDWKGSIAPAMTGDAFARLGAPAGASVSADVAAVKSDTGTILTDVNTGAGAIYTRLGAPAGVSIAADIAAVETNAAAIKAKTDNLPASPAAVGSAMALTSTERNATADAILDRDMSVGTDNGSPTVRTVRQALRFLRNKWAIATGTLTVYKEDDITSSWTASVTTDAAAIPIISNDPAG